ncbi:MAG: T9SS type A sorting domain-containing protein [Candidatus Neomarinimicrobiota bacterium]
MNKYFFIVLLVGTWYVKASAVIIANSQAHIDYGLSYPVTYEFSIPQNSQNLYAYRKYKNSQDWNLIDEKSKDDFFNGIEAVRFDYEEYKAYVSVGFSVVSDTIYIKIENNTDQNVNATYIRMCEYYDNRKAVVTITGDDWADWNNDNFIQSCQNFRSFNLWYSVAVITNSYQSNWDDIQTQLDLGLIEVVSHSRTHPYVPYNNIESEVIGSKLDIIENLNLLNHNRSGDNEYVYAWVAPYGEYSSQIDTMASNANYLISRLFYWNDNYYSDWNNDLNKFNPVGASIELGNSSYWGSYDINDLNSTFQSVIDENGIYHLTTHPNILQWDENFTWEHLEYISNRKDIWYVGFGHLYLYRFISSSDQVVNLNITENIYPKISNIKLHQNYPNPFNPTTSLRYDLSNDGFVNITIYDMMGGIVKTLVNGSQTAGYKFIKWNANNDNNEPVSAGIYLCTISAGELRQTKKMILLK